MNTLDTYKVAIFDCDGVILDSNKVKSEAFAQALSDENPALVKRFIEYHQEHGGISRYIKFEHFFKNIKGQTDYCQSLKEALDRYADLSKAGLLECMEIAGARDVLAHFKRLEIPCFVASGGDQKEVREVLECRDLSHFFEGIFGSPLSKLENLNGLKVSGKFELPGIYFGDALSDMQAASEFGLDFVYIAGASEWGCGRSCSEENGFDVVDDFTQVNIHV